jgi:hypothetical protein
MLEIDADLAGTVAAARAADRHFVIRQQASVARLQD